MKTSNTLTAVLITLACWGHCCSAQDNSNGLVVEFASIANSQLTGPGPLSPTVGSSYAIAHGLGAENPNDGTGLGFFFGVQPDPNTGTINNAVMNNQASVIGVDFADALGFPVANEIIAYECIESLGIDLDSGRFLLELTVTVATKATELQWDSLEFDLLDPADIDGDGDSTHFSNYS